MSTIRNMLTRHHAELEARIVELQAELADVRLALQALAATKAGVPAIAAPARRSPADSAAAAPGSARDGAALAPPAQGDAVVIPRRSPAESALPAPRSPGESAVRAYRNSATADAGG